ncbi:hypothetical protein JK628_18315 [Shewanella sp. KX20019]|uniref:hypothetical protein n=1 Tax=Shewanella sp. KX20019 TaxID=2803864 RepID=UPI0019270680|nr:hypothetical protein [Shewanella sp. KX20019]QQX79462.1 hypothetical protein JK628_18315 [Shewanella sp. KX20019]
MYQWTVCDPIIENVIQKGEIKKEDIALKFESYPWTLELKKLTENLSKDIHYNPSLEFIDVTNNRGIIFSAVPENEEFIFYVFYQRPEVVKKWFGLTKWQDPKHVTDRLDQSFDSAKDLLKLFLNQDFDKLNTFF